MLRPVAVRIALETIPVNYKRGTQHSEIIDERKKVNENVKKDFIT